MYTRIVTTEALLAYNKALRKLGEALNDPSQRYSQNTLCALHLINACQILVSRPCDKYVSHLTVMGVLLPEAIAQNWTDLFGQVLIMYTAIVVVSPDGDDSTH